MKNLLSNIAAVALMLCAGCLSLNDAAAQEIYTPTGAVAATITSSGKVGIGNLNNNPESKLHVKGDIRIRKQDRVIFGDGGNGSGEWIQNMPAGTGWGLSFFGNSTVRMQMTNDGLFGIGDNLIPANRLHVKGTGNADPVRIQTLNNAYDSVVVTIDNLGVLHQRRLNFNAIPNLSCNIINRVPVVTAGNTLGCSQIFDNGTSVGIATTGPFTYTGYSGMLSGTVVPAATGVIKLQVNGVVRALAAIITSDRNYKTDITEIKSPLEIITKLKGKMYRWNKTAQAALSADNGVHFGVIAQECMEVLPEVVMKDENGVLGVNYTEMIPVLIEAVKEQQATIMALKGQIEELKKARK